jgi:hypothetical protein
MNLMFLLNIAELNRDSEGYLKLGELLQEKAAGDKLGSNLKEAISRKYLKHNPGLSKNSSDNKSSLR